MAGTTTRKTPARRGRTVASVDKDVKVLKADVADLKSGVDNILALLTAKAEQKANEDIQSQVQWTEEPAVAVGEFSVDEYDEDEDFEFDDYEEEEVSAPIDPRDFQARGYAREAPKKKKRVGQRNGDRIIRNIRPHMARFRLGNPRDPCRVPLE